MAVDRMRAIGLHDRGVAAYAKGDHRAALRHFESSLAILRRALGDSHPDVAAGLNNLGVVSSHLGDYRAARRFHEEALAIRRRCLGGDDASVAESLNNLGAVYRGLGEHARAKPFHEEAVSIWRHRFGDDDPNVAIGLTSLGNSARETGDHAAARQHHEQALAIRQRASGASHPSVADSLGNLGAVATELGQHEAARRHHEQALAIRRETLSERHPLVAESLNNIGAVVRKLNDDETARRCFEQALSIDPELAVAHRNLAALLAAEGRHEEAERHRAKALTRQCVFVEPAAHAEKSVLVLLSAESANVPIDNLLRRETTTLIRWFVEFASDAQAKRLPAYDITFNAIGDPDLAERSRPRVTGFLRTCRRPVLNPPGRVKRTQRDLMPALLRDIPGLVLPPVVRLAREALHGPGISAAVARAGIAPPFLVRPAGAHGGSGLVRVDTAEELASIDPQGSDAVYVTGFHDYRSPDGCYRKYRMIFVDRQPYPYHLAIADGWLVHYFSADMLQPRKIAEERRFLDRPAEVIGAAGIAAVTAIGARLDLDYAGLDFTVLEDGRVLVFEANATMLVHAEEPGGPLAHKNAHVQRIVDAFDAMIARRMREAGNVER